MCRNPLGSDLRRKAYTAIAAKMLARIAYGLIKNGNSADVFKAEACLNSV